MVGSSGRVSERGVGRCGNFSIELLSVFVMGSGGLGQEALRGRGGTTALR